MTQLDRLPVLNEHDKAMGKLEGFELKDYFLFPHVEVNTEA